MAPPPHLKVAFLGDQGLGANAVAVLEMVQKWGAQGLVHLGDFDYQDSPMRWIEMYNNIFDDDFPVFVSVGNVSV